MKHRNSQSGFSLLEVIIAIAILALGFTALFAAQTQAAQTAYVARGTATAAMLARCKMGEIEEEITRNGLPAIDDQGRGECCEGTDIAGYECEWKIERVVLPDDFGDEGGLLGDGEEESAGPDIGALAADQDAQNVALNGMLNGGGGGGGGGGLAEMAISIAYPVLKPSIEEQVRRATVTISWSEGQRSPSFEVVQYLVAEQPPAQAN